jgi:hypothetical protein
MQQLNIFDLYKTVTDKKANSKFSFEQVMLKCHSKIKLASKNSHFACFYEVPEVVIGIPLYNITECISYIISGLKDNGFLVKYLYPKIIYICWDPKIINKTDIERYTNNNDVIADYDHFLLTNNKPMKNAKGKFTLNIND